MEALPSADRAWLERELRELFAGSQESLVGLEVHERIQPPPGELVWSAKAIVSVNDRPPFTLVGAGPSAAAAYVDFLGNAMATLHEASELLQRSLAPCWVCNSQRERTSMEAQVIGGEIWWLCDRCQQRRANAARIGVVWPTDYAAWVRRWRAEQRTAGRDGSWITDVEAEAGRRFDVDPFLTNRMLAVMAVAEERA